MAGPTASSVSSKAGFSFFAVAAVSLAAVIIWPQVDLAVSGLFYKPDEGFPLDYNPAFQAVHRVATYGAWGLAALLFFGAVIAGIRRRPLLTVTAKNWLFLFLALAIGPGLIANMGFKDHWGRARPAQVTEFGGSHSFSPALVPQENAHKNGSFVAGDPAFGFFLPCFAYVVSRRRSRRVFWTGMGMGGLLSLLRISMGAHFLSDTLFAGLLVLATTTALHAAMFGRSATKPYWRNWMFAANDD